MGKQVTIDVKGSFGLDAKATILHNKLIRIFGTYQGRAFDKTFAMGEDAEYDSYNLSYYGPITKITEKTVTIQHSYSSVRTRLPIDRFMWRNYDFDLAETAAKNSDTMMYI